MRLGARWLTILLPLSIAAACGARSGLAPAPPDAASDSGPEDAGADQDAAADVSEDVTPDSPSDAFPDLLVDGLAPCDPEDLFVYLVTSEKDFYRYDPASGEVKLVGALDCPVDGNPFSMGVSRLGVAYVVYRPNGLGATPPGKLFMVNVENAACAKTSFEPNQHGFKLFGMGFALNDDGQGETLYVAESGKPGADSLGLASIDLGSFALTPVGPFSQNPGNRIELTSSDDGKLWGYILDPAGNGGYVAHIDKHTAEVLAVTPVAAGNDHAFAFAHWGGDFYVFTSPSGGPTKITRYSPADGSTTVVGSIAKTVVGAGVSTCSVK
ncbi:MAG: hypothetical protein AMXMBFR56_74800 [Polyangiaceae bacterium]